MLSFSWFGNPSTLHLFTIDRHFGCFRMLAILSNIAASRGYRFVISIVCIPRSEIAGSFLIVLCFWGSSITFSIVEALLQFTFPPVVHRGSLFSAFLSVFVISCLFDNSWLLLLVQMLFVLLFVERSLFWQWSTERNYSAPHIHNSWDTCMFF